MHLHDFLARIHRDLEPRTYLEVGVKQGKSLALSRAPSIGIDPAFEIRCPLHCDLRLVRATSDAHFASDDPIGHFGGLPVDLSFVDGMHLFEYALRDFVNVERFSHAGGVVVFDDMLPAADRDADRTRHRGFWAGDVFKIVPVLHRYRPDLRLIPVNTSPTGVLVVVGLDPENTVLADNYDSIVSEFVVDDPQRLPDEIRERTCALEPDQVLSTPLAKRLRAVRDADDDPARVAADVEEMLGLGDLPRLGDWSPASAEAAVGEGSVAEPPRAGSGARVTRQRHPAIRAVGRALPRPVRRRLRRYAAGRHG